MFFAIGLFRSVFPNYRPKIIPLSNFVASSIAPRKTNKPQRDLG